MSTDATIGLDVGPTDRYVTIPDLMAYLNVSRSTIRRLRAAGMPEITVGASPRFHLASVIAWLEQRSPVRRG